MITTYVKIIDAKNVHDGQKAAPLLLLMIFMKNKTRLSKSLGMGLFFLAAFATSSMYSVEANAKKKPKKAVSKVSKKVAAAPMCSADTAITTMYFVPHIKDFCPTAKPCSKFKKSVKMQGTGTLYNNQVLRYTGKTETLPANCNTAVGSRGTCLTPFISVAADPRHHRVGDYIKMPSLKGKLITMPDGKVVEHPGFLIVEDVGAAIKGPNRFDFFTGSFGQFSSDNVFGSHGWKDPAIADKNMCSASKKFAKVDRNTTDYVDAEEDIARFMSEISGPTRALASYEHAGKNVGGRK